ncbi:uncharacterized protein LOC135380723 [Ornithodoros turicata]|uniref:uncharacterized protein LOC135380723 n=1 Tax=Ornithodoros turicata TaxID=34597 RepID=UPI003138652A
MERLKSKRGTRRAQTTRILNEASTALKDGTASAEALNALLQRLTTSNAELVVLNTAIEPLVTDEDYESECAGVLEYEDRVTETVANLNWKLAQLQAAAASSMGSLNEPSLPQASSQQRHIGIKLPKLRLPTFSGKLSEWHSFWEQFSTTVHEKKNLVKIEKFQAYDDATEILKERFGDRGRIERQLLARLRSLPAVKSSSDVLGLRRFYDHVQSHIRGLRSLGVQDSSYAAMLTEILLSSQPSEIVIDFYRSVHCPTTTSTASPTDAGDTAAPSTSTTASDELQAVLKFLHVEVESREKSEVAERNLKKQIQPVSKPATLGRANPSAAVLHNASTNPAPCFFCSNTEHSTL